MLTQQLLQLAIAAGYEISDYGDMYSIKAHIKTEFVVTVPNVTYLLQDIADKIRKLLGI